MTEHVIEVRNLTKRYNGRNEVLHDVTFSVDGSEFVIVSGRSGCGKTTLLNILGGLDRPTSGSVAIDGEHLEELSEDQLASLRLKKVGVVYQDFNLLMDLTVRENISLPLKFSKKKDEGKVNAMLDKFDIRHIAGETANRISGGEAQRVAIARALMNEPKIVLADEPTGNLDMENTDRVMQTFGLVREEFGATIVLATHDKDLAGYATTRILLESGRAIIND